MLRMIYLVSLLSATTTIVATKIRRPTKSHLVAKGWSEFFPRREKIQRSERSHAAISYERVGVRGVTSANSFMSFPEAAQSDHEQRLRLFGPNRIEKEDCFKWYVSLSWVIGHFDKY
jgi:hypothetical protein